MARGSFEEAYLSLPPWDIGRPQGEIIRLAEEGEIRGSVLVPGGTFRMLCFSEREPGGWVPRRVTQQEIREVFDRGWKVDSIREARFETNLGPEGCRAWLSSITRG